MKRDLQRGASERVPPGFLGGCGARKYVNYTRRDDRRCSEQQALHPPFLPPPPPLPLPPSKALFLTRFSDHQWPTTSTAPSSSRSTSPARSATARLRRSSPSMKSGGTSNRSFGTRRIARSHSPAPSLLTSSTRSSARRPARSSNTMRFLTSPNARRRSPSPHRRNLPNQRKRIPRSRQLPSPHRRSRPTPRWIPRSWSPRRPPNRRAPPNPNRRPRHQRCPLSSQRPRSCLRCQCRQSTRLSARPAPASSCATAGPLVGTHTRPGAATWAVRWSTSVRRARGAESCETTTTKRRRLPVWLPLR